MRAVFSSIVIAGAALMVSACGSKETTTVTNTVEVVPVENVTVTDTMTVTNVDAAADNAVVETTTTNTTTTTVENAM